jgi:Ca2+-binding EF-hand superfamily protein
MPVLLLSRSLAWDRPAAGPLGWQRKPVAGNRRSVPAAPKRNIETKGIDMSVATVQQDRLARRFDLWDNDRNGRIERSDYEAEARTILQKFGEPETSPRGKALLDAYLQMWDFMARQAGIGPSDGMDKQTFVQVAERSVLQHGDTGYAAVVRPTIRAIVDLCDTDGDGQVNRNEWKKWADAIGMSSQEAETAFRGIDADGDGQLTVDELVQAVNDYHAGRTDVELLGR